MTLFIQDYDTEEVLFQTENAFTAPLKNEGILFGGKWYVVVERGFYFEHLNNTDNNKCCVFVREANTNI